MELILNSVWAVVAFVTLCLWLRLDCRDQAERRRSLIALCLLVVILFPVISVSDDLWAIQNPAEESGQQRKDRLASALQPVSTLIAILPMIVTPQHALVELGFCEPLLRSKGSVESPALHTVENRPPPAQA